MSRPAVFLDRDGTIVEDKGYLDDPAGVRVLPTVVDALRLLRERGFATVVVSNQSGIARGFFGEDTVRAVNDEIVRRLAQDGVALDAWYWCPHFDEGCTCRKPEPGLIHRAIEELDLSLDGGAVVGDRGSDIALGHAVGVAGILLPGPYAYVGPEPEFRAETLLEAAQWIVAAAHGGRRTLRQAQGDTGRDHANTRRADDDTRRGRGDAAGRGSGRG